MKNIVLVAGFVLCPEITKVVQGNFTYANLPLVLRNHKVFCIGRRFCRCVTAFKTKCRNTTAPCKRGMEHHLSDSENIQHFVGTHQIMRVGSGKTGNDLLLK